MKRKIPLASLSPGLAELLAAHAGIAGGLPKNSKRLAELAAGVKELSDAYVEPAACDWQGLYKNPAAVAAYLLYYLPVNLVKLFPLLEELVAGSGCAAFTRQELRVLDIGCGPGTFMLGMLEYLGRSARQEAGWRGTISFTGLDRRRENLAAAERLMARYCSSGCLPRGMAAATQFVQASISEPALLPSEAPYELIIAGNVMAELDDAALAPAAAWLAGRVADGGALIIIDPGTHRASRRLLVLRDMLQTSAGLQLYAPCLRQGTCPLRDDPAQWCHEKLYWQPTDAVRLIDRELGFTKEKGIKYSYLTFVRQEANRLGRLAASDEGKIWRVGSYVIRHKGEDRLWVCNGRERLQLRRLERNRSETNRDFTEARRGDLVFIDGAVARAAFYDMPKEAVFSIMG